MGGVTMPISEDENRETLSECSMQSLEASQAGFCRPPAAHRFKPGQSGNPRGRRKVPGNIISSFQEGLKEPVRVTKGATVKKISKEEAALRMLIKKALEGDWKAFMSLIKKGVKLGIIKPPKLPDFKGGVVVLEWRCMDLPQNEYWAEVHKEAARRNALFAQGLPYDRQQAFQWGKI
jgi:hypothetical protein